MRSSPLLSKPVCRVSPVLHTAQIEGLLCRLNSEEWCFSRSLRREIQAPLEVFPSWIGENTFLPSELKYPGFVRQILNPVAVGPAGTLHEEN
jgi:hypothetical protein